MEKSVLKQQLLEKLNNEDLFFMRKQYGMFGRINFKITDLTPDTLYLKVWSRREDVEPERTCHSIANGILNFTRDILPSSICHAAFYFREDDPEAVAEYDIDFLWKGEERPSNSILIEENAGPHREKARKVYEVILEELFN